MIKIKTPVGNTFVIDEEDMKHYPDAEVVDEDEEIEEPEDE